MTEARGGMGAAHTGRNGVHHLTWEDHRRFRSRGLRWGCAAAGLLVLVYVIVLAAVSSMEHVLEDFLLLWYWMVPLIVGFGIQSGLFAYARGALRHHDATGSGGLAASGGVNAVAMVACCAHHLTDVLPLVGLAGVALLLSGYQSLFLLVGVLSSFVGTTYMLGTYRRHALRPPEGSFLASVVQFPFDRAVPAAIGVSAVILVIVAAVTIF